MNSWHKFIEQNPNIFAVLLLFIVTLSSVAYQGFSYPYINNVYHIPIVLDYFSSAEGPHDVFHETLGNFSTLLWPILSSFVTESNIYGVFLAIHIIARFLMALVIWRIVQCFTGKNNYSALFVGFIFFIEVFLDYSLLGRNEIMAEYLTHSQVVIPFILLSWLYLLKNKFLFASAVIGIAFNLNAFVAIWTGIVAWTFMVYMLRNLDTVGIAKKSAEMAGVFLVFSLPTATWIFQILSSSPTMEQFDFRQYLMDYYPYHTFIHVQWQRGLALAVLFIAGVLLVRKINIFRLKQDTNLIFLIFFVHAAIVLAGVFLPYLTDFRLLLNLFPLRMDAYLTIIVGMAIIIWCAAAFRAGEQHEKAYSLISLLSLINGNIALLLVAVLSATPSSPKLTLEKYIPVVLLVGLAGAHVYYGYALSFLNPGEGIKAGLILLIQCGVIAYMIPRGKYYFEQTLLLIGVVFIGIIPVASGFMELLLVLSYLMVGTNYLVKDKYKKQLILSFILLLLTLLSIENYQYGLVFLFVIFIPVVLNKYYSLRVGYPSTRSNHNALLVISLFLLLVILGLLSFYKRGDISHRAFKEASLLEAQQWARNNTAPGTMFLPVGVYGFSIFSRRPVWVERQTGAMVMWSPETYGHWWERWSKLKDVTNIEEARKLAELEKIKYIVLAKNVISIDESHVSCAAFENEMILIIKECDVAE